MYTDNLEETFHDIISSRKRLKNFAAYRLARGKKRLSKINLFYVGTMYLMFSYLLGMSAKALALTTDDKAVFFHSFHVFLLVLFGILNLTIRVTNDENLIAAVESLRKGVYAYADEICFQYHTELKRTRVGEIRRISMRFSNFIFVGAVSNLLVLPVLQYLAADGDTSSKPLNPYLPQPFYMPFDTRSYLGYGAGFIINVLFMASLCSIVVCVDEFYTSLLIQAKTQFELLCHSLANIESRAMARMQRKNPCYTSASKDDIEKLYRSKEFQDCMYSCLKSNILHHQAILRLLSHFKSFTQSTFLVVLLLASLILAALVLLILENPGYLIVGNFTASLSVEILFTFHFCFYGEELATESGEVFHFLYSTPWPLCNSRFRKLVHIMLANSRKPVTTRTLSFNITASLETFGNIINTVYQIMNVLRGKNY